MTRHTKTKAEKFWPRVDKNGPILSYRLGRCWVWTGIRMSPRYEYGKLTGMGLAHRASYEIHYGSPGEKHVLHKCDNPICVNPKHLFLGTHQTNMADMRTKGRYAHGERQGGSILTEEAVKDIRANYKKYTRSGPHSVQYLATKYGVGIQQIRKVTNKVQWKHLT